MITFFRDNAPKEGGTMAAFRFLSFILVTGFSGSLYAISIDLNTFDPNPPDNIVIAGDGSSAVFSEDDTISPISLENLNFFIPANADLLTFDYFLTVPVDNEDFFDFFIEDISTPEFSVGGYTDPSISSSPIEYVGNHSVDLFSFRGTTVPVIFDLQFGFYDSGLDSVLTISNVQLTQVNSIPEPGTAFLLAFGLSGFFIVYRRRQRS